MSLGFNRKVDYALVALAALAGARADAEPVSARQLAQDYRLPGRMLMNILKQLHAAGLIDSTRGSGGGYQLAHSPGTISITDVIEAVEGPVSFTACCEPDSEEVCLACEVAPNCPITASMRRLNSVMVALLQRVTLADLLSGSVDEALKGIESRGQQQRRDWVDVRPLVLAATAMAPAGGSARRSGAGQNRPEHATRS